MAVKPKFDQEAAFKSIIGIGAGGQTESLIEATTEAQQNKATGRGRPKAEREIKQRISLAVLPSLYYDIKKIAFVERKSISEIISDCIEKYIKENAAKLKEYDNLKKR